MLDFTVVVFKYTPISLSLSLRTVSRKFSLSLLPILAYPPCYTPLCKEEKEITTVARMQTHTLTRPDTGGRDERVPEISIVRAHCLDVVVKSAGTLVQRVLLLPYTPLPSRTTHAGALARLYNKHTKKWKRAGEEGGSPPGKRHKSVNEQRHDLVRLFDNDQRGAGRQEGLLFSFLSFVLSVLFISILRARWFLPLGMVVE